MFLGTRYLWAKEFKQVPWVDRFCPWLLALAGPFRRVDCWGTGRAMGKKRQADDGGRKGTRACDRLEGNNRESPENQHYYKATSHFQGRQAPHIYLSKNPSIRTR